LLTWVLQRGYQNDLSFAGVSNAVESQLQDVWNTPVTEEQKRVGAELMAKSEENRIAAMREYAAKTASEADR
jgi:hypothetical protein